MFGRSPRVGCGVLDRCGTTEISNPRCGFHGFAASSSELCGIVSYVEAGRTGFGVDLIAGVADEQPFALVR